MVCLRELFAKVFSILLYFLGVFVLQSCSNSKTEITNLSSQTILRITFSGEYKTSKDIDPSMGLISILGECSQRFSTIKISKDNGNSWELPSGSIIASDLDCSDNNFKINFDNPFVQFNFAPSVKSEKSILVRGEYADVKLTPSLPSEVILVYSPQPLTAILTGLPTNPTNNVSLNMGVTGISVSKYQYKLGPSLSTFCDVNVDYSSDIDVGTPITNLFSGSIDQVYKVCVVGKDAFGNSQPYESATTYTWRLDTIPPAATLSGVPSGNNNSTALNVTVSGDDVVAYRFKVGSAVSMDCSDPNGYSLSDSLKSQNIMSDLSGIADGSVTLCVVGKDTAGNYQPYASASLTSWIKDTVAPTTVGSFSDGVMLYSASNSPHFTWGASSDITSGTPSYLVAIGDSLGASNTLNWTNIGSILSQFFNSLPLMGSKRYYGSIKSIDGAGNVSSMTQGDGWWNLAGKNLAVDSTSPTARMLSKSSYLGYSSAISEDGTTLVVGAIYDSTDQNGENQLSNSGAAFVYVKSFGNWVLQQKLVGMGVNGRTSGDNFGSSVAISGDTIVVGASAQDYDESGANAVVDAGAAYVFTRSAGVWSQQQKLVGTGINSRKAGDNFGVSVGISGDTVVVGAFGQDYDENGANAVIDAGATYVFTRSAGVWTQQQKIVGTGANSRTTSDKFGGSVGISGETVVVGASAQDYDENGANSLINTGAAYVFTRIASVWSQQQKLVGTGINGRVANDNFGSSVAISSDTVVVGASLQDYDDSGVNPLTDAGAAFVFIRSAGVWSQQQKLVGAGINGRMISDNFGMSVGISGDTVIVGANNQDYDESGANSISSAGAAFIYSRTGGVWSQQQKMVGIGTNDRIANDNFGFSVSVSSNIVFVGAPYQDYDSNGLNLVDGAGAGYVFSLSGSWNLDNKVVDTIVPASRAELVDAKLGSAIALSEDGQTMVVGAPNDDTDEFGRNYIVNAGAVYVYIKSSGVWSLQQKLIGSGTNGRMTNDNFGVSVAISNDTIVVGASNQDYDHLGSNPNTNSGAAYVFIRSGSVWSLQQKLVASGTNARMGLDNFGTSVGISADTIVVGSPGQDYDSIGSTPNTDTGAAYLFTRSGMVWSQQQKLVGSGTNGRISFDKFGSSVFIEDTTVVIGSPYQDYDSSGTGLINDAGAAFVFFGVPGTMTFEQKLVGTGTNGRLASDNFGSSVSLSGNTIVIGSPGQDYDLTGSNLLTDAGAAYVFTKPASTWSLQQKLVDSNPSSRASIDKFGSSVSINGDSIVVGSPYHDLDENNVDAKADAGAAYIFTRQFNIWSIAQKLLGFGFNGRIAGDNFGSAVAISENGAADGYTIAIGSENHSYTTSGASPTSGAGAVFVFY